MRAYKFGIRYLLRMPYFSTGSGFSGSEQRTTQQGAAAFTRIGGQELYTDQASLLSAMKKTDVGLDARLSALFLSAFKILANNFGINISVKMIFAPSAFIPMDQKGIFAGLPEALTNRQTSP